MPVPIGSANASRLWVRIVGANAPSGLKERLDLGVLPDWRGRGLGLALLSDVFAHLQRGGFGRAALHVDAENTTGAVRLYRKAGMIPEPALVVWERSIETF
jgi:ribosomal protein S18 acetylase RimI-like enzyme